MSGVVVERDEAACLDLEFQAPPVVQAFLEDPTFVTAYFGPIGCAKTTGGCLKAWMYATAYPGARILVGRDTWPNLRDTTQKTFFEWFPDGVAGHYEREPKTFWLHTGEDLPPAEIIFRAFADEADINNALSLNLAAAFLDEPQGGVSMRTERGITHEPGINRNLFHALLGRLGRQDRQYPKMAWLTGNPPDPMHWIAKEFAYDPGPSGCAPPANTREGFRLYLGTQDTNRHHLPERYYEDLEAIYGYDTPMARRFLKGLWIPFATSKPFHPHWIKYAGRDGEPERPDKPDLEILLGVDPAISKKDTANYTGLTIFGQSRKPDLTQGRLFCLEAWKGHWSPYEQVDHILKAYARWPIRKVVIEDVAYQRSLGDILEREAKVAGVNVHVKLVKPDADKLRRANAWSGLVEAGTVLFGAGQEELIGAMLGVPDDPSLWDLVDAAGLAIREFPKLEAAQMRLPAKEPVAAVARSYAVRPYREDASPPRPVTPFGPGAQTASTPRRAIGYAVRRQHGPRGPGSVVGVGGRR